MATYQPTQSIHEQLRALIDNEELPIRSRVEQISTILTALGDAEEEKYGDASDSIEEVVKTLDTLNISAPGIEPDGFLTLMDFTDKADALREYVSDLEEAESDVADLFEAVIVGVKAAEATTGPNDPVRINFLASIVATAVEGGIGYWAEIRNYHWAHDGDLTGNLTQAYVEARPQNEEEAEWNLVTLPDIERGIAKIKDGSTEIARSVKKDILIADNENDASEIDSEAADCIVQAALFGTLVYG